MPRTPEDEDFLLQRAALAPLAEPPEELAALVPEDEEALLPTEPEVDMAPPPVVTKVAPLPAKDPYGPGADRAALEAAIKDRASTDNSARFMDAIESFNHAGGGTAKDLSASTRARRDDSFNDVMRRRALADQDAAAGKRQRDQDLDEAMRDPGSDVSVRARALFSGTTVGRALRERMGDRFEALSANQLPGARDIISSETDLLKAQAKAGHTGPDERTGALEALVAAAGGPDSPRGQFFQQGFANAPLKVIKDQGFGLLTREEKQKFDLQMQGIRDTAAMKRAQTMAGVNVEKEFRGDRSELSKTLDKAGGFFPNLKVIEGIMAKHTDKSGKVGDLPTVGIAAKPITDLGGGFLRSTEGQELAKAADQMQLAYRNLVTGSAASTEEDRRIAAAGLDRRNLSGFITGLQLMKGRYQDLLRRTYAGYEPEVAQGYIARNPDYGIKGDAVYDPSVAAGKFKNFEAASQGQHIIPGRGAPALPTDIPVSAPRRLRINGKLYEEAPDGEAVEVEEVDEEL